MDYTVSGGKGGGIGAHPASLLTARPTVDLGRARGNHGTEFIAAVKSRTPTTVGIDIAVRSDVLLHLTDVAVRTGRRLTWDPVKEEIHGDAEASRLLKRALREPWRL